MASDQQPGAQPAGDPVELRDPVKLPTRAQGVPPAGPPQPPPLGRAAQRAQGERHAELLLREERERRSLERGLIVLAVGASLFALLHFGTEHAFPPGWWRRW